MKVLALSAVIILLGLGAVRARSQPARVGVPAGGGVALEQYLGELGQLFDCSFTIEEAYVKGSNLALLSARVAAKPDPKAKLEEQLEALRKEVPHLTFAASKTNPRIIHIVDDRLAAQQGYAPDDVLKSIAFKGTVVELIGEISKQGIPITSPNTVSTEEALFWDVSTVVRVKGVNLKVRDALSLFLPRKKYSQVLWVARTNLGQGERTYVTFSGPRS